mmetsp:Transcript_21343/g.63847  ORF Transcript_21343/g.63847 Transcript_21343/m.63847 type:complete len:206 (-) Transcript_21343:1357-1974(-)
MKSGNARSVATSQPRQHTPFMSSQPTQTPPSRSSRATSVSTSFAALCLFMPRLIFARSRSRWSTDARHLKWYTTARSGAYFAPSPNGSCAPSVTARGRRYATTFGLRRNAQSNGNAAKSAAVPEDAFRGMGARTPRSATRSVHSPPTTSAPAASARLRTSRSGASKTATSSESAWKIQSPSRSNPRCRNRAKATPRRTASLAGPE